MKLQRNGDDHENNVFTYIEFGSINRKIGKKEIYDFRVDQKAYDWLMHARYSNDIFAYKQMTDALITLNIEQIISIFKNEIHHNNDFIFNLNKKIALDITGDSFFELGQTLYGCIDSIDFINKLEQHLFPANSQKIYLKNINWFGVDISSFFNFMARKIHEGYKIHTSTLLCDSPVRYDVFYAKGITLLYAINSASELFNLVANAKIAVFDYSISLTEQKDTYIGTGKSVRFLSKVQFNSFVKLVRGTGKDVWVRGNLKGDFKTNRLYFEVVIADYFLFNIFMEKQNDYILTLQKNEPMLFATLVHNKDPHYFKWSKFSDSCIPMCLQDAK